MKTCSICNLKTALFWKSKCPRCYKRLWKRQQWKKLGRWSRLSGEPMPKSIREKMSKSISGQIRSFKIPASRFRTRKLFSIKGKKCFICKSDAKCRHHIDRDILNNDLSNVQLLCFSCHGKIHSPIKGIKRGPYKKNNIEVEVLNGRP
jgi:hypothetical protein